MNFNYFYLNGSVFEDVMFQVIGHSRNGYKISQTPVTSYEVADEMEGTWVIGLPLSVLTHDRPHKIFVAIMPLAQVLVNYGINGFFENCLRRRCRSEFGPALTDTGFVRTAQVKKLLNNDPVLSTYYRDLTKIFSPGVFIKDNMDPSPDFTD